MKEIYGVLYRRRWSKFDGLCREDFNRGVKFFQVEMGGGGCDK